jgi:hypothetical protein
MTSVISQPSQREVAMPATKLLINNRWTVSETGKTFATINPSIGEEICQVSEADATDGEKAVKQRVQRSNLDHGARRAHQSEDVCSTVSPTLLKTTPMILPVLNPWTTVCHSPSRKPSMLLPL